jgi:hypothetical protein
MRTLERSDMPSTDHLASASSLSVEPWPDPVIDQLGHDPRSTYVEHFWLSILGPSTVWLLRRLADGLDREPEGYSLDLEELARSIGVGTRGGRNSPFIRTLDRSCRFGASRFVAHDTLAVRRRLAPLNQRQVTRLPESLQHAHARWVDAQSVDAQPEPPTAELMRQRARQLALSLIELGEDPAAAERQLHRWRFHPSVAFESVRWAIEHHGVDDTAAVGTGGEAA